MPILGRSGSSVNESVSGVLCLGDLHDPAFREYREAPYASRCQTDNRDEQDIRVLPLVMSDEIGTS